MEGYCDPSSFINACSAGKLNAVEFMLKAGADPNVHCWTDPDATDAQCEKTSALGAAEANGHPAVVELLKKSMKRGNPMNVNKIRIACAVINSTQFAAPASL